MNANFLFTKTTFLLLLVLTISSGTLKTNITKPTIPNLYGETIGLDNSTNIPIIDSIIAYQPKPLVEEKVSQIALKDTRRYVSNKYPQLIRYIRDHEGFRTKMYYCTEGAPTIGWGHVIKANESYLRKGITQYQGDSILYADIRIREKIVNNLIVRDNLSLNANQKLALIHFIYALGEGTLMKSTLYNRIKNNKPVREQDFTNYCRVKGKKSMYAYKIREWEYALYLE